MPYISRSTYRAPVWLAGGHAQTIHPVLFRKVNLITKETERLELEDGDFLDLAWSKSDSKRLTIISHGLEGSYRATYVQGIAAALSKQNIDTLAWSFRGCGDEANRLPSFYHSGKTEDLEHIVRHAIENHGYQTIDLIGFSLGGNLTLKYIGERGKNIRPEIHGGVAFSVPCMLADSSATLAKLSNRIYMERFLKTLREKVRTKHSVFPADINIDDLEKIRTFQQFDDRYTAPLHGFKDADDYWEKSSCRQYLENINIPTLLVSAKNDPILGPGCYPVQEAQNSDYFHLETPSTGGHVGFGTGTEYWSERRAVEFLTGS